MPKYKTLSGLHPSILKRSRRGNISPIITKAEGREPVSVVLAFPGCDFEACVVNEVVIAFRHGDVCYALEDEAPQVYICMPSPNWETVAAGEFNAAFVDHLLVALKGVANGPEVVASSAHFTKVIGKAIGDLDKITRRNYTKIDSIKTAVSNVKERLFSWLMSKDLRR